MKRFGVILIPLLLSSCSMQRAVLRDYKAGNYAAVLARCAPRAELNDPRCQYVLGTLYYYGQGVDKNAETAAKWIRRSSDSGFRYSELKLGELYFSGEGLEKNESEALKHWEQAANNGLKEAQFRLYGYYSSSVQDPALAEQWLEKAASNGFVTAQVTLGTKLCADAKAQTCRDKGIELLRKAAATGNIQAERSLGMTLFNSGMPSKGLEPLTQAAAAGDTEAQFMLGTAYLGENGIPENTQEAYKWLWLAKAGGSQPAALVIHGIETEMKKEDAAKAISSAQLIIEKIKIDRKNRRSCTLQESAFLD